MTAGRSTPRAITVPRSCRAWQRARRWSTTWTFFDGEWHEGNVPLWGARTHAIWLGSSVFDGARVFEGVAPDLDLHCARVNASAKTMYLKPTMTADEIVGLTREGMKKFDKDVTLYVRPMYWAERPGPQALPPDPDSTRFALTLYDSPMRKPDGFSITLSPFRRPTWETAPVDAKAGCLYPNNARALFEAKSRGFDNAIVCDVAGNVAELANSNVFMGKDGVVMTPIPNGTFLAGITRMRVIGLLRDAGITRDREGAALCRFRGGRRDFRHRQRLQGAAGDAHRRALAATRPALPQGARALLGLRAFVMLSARGPRRRAGHATDRADGVGAVFDKTACRRGRMRRADRQIKIAHRAVDWIAPALDQGVLQRPGKLPLELHVRQLIPFREMLRRGRQCPESRKDASR